MKPRKKIPLGVSDYKKLIEEDYYYIDKTLLIKELLDLGVEVALLLRPRRFGKTVNISMLRYFFENDDENEHLFEPFAIWKEEECRRHQGQYPVIYLTLKDVKHDTWPVAYEKICALMAHECRRHGYLADSPALSSFEKDELAKLMHKEASYIELEGSLLFLSACLKKHFNQKVIILIDEYDAPIHSGYTKGYYDDALLFCRNWLSNGLKDNVNLARAVLTGILRVAKESIFSGLNNVIPYTLLSNPFSDKFGLLESELQTLLKEYDLKCHHHAAKEWYNGYLVGEHLLYNPWSILQFVSNAGKLIPYWINSSDNVLIQQLISRGSGLLKSDLELLLQNEELVKPLYDSVEFRKLDDDVNTVWTLLLFSGYLTASPTDSQTTIKLKIPNREIMSLFEGIIRSWFKVTSDIEIYTTFLKSLICGDIATFAELFQSFLLHALSYHDISSDESERVYHAFVLGMLLGLRHAYEVRSNRESGFGRYDVLLIPKDTSQLGIIFEFKKAHLDRESLEEAAEKALQQIATQKYAEELHARGIQRVLALGMAFSGKKAFIKQAYC